MKTISTLILMFSVPSILFSMELPRYKHLHKLPENSRIKNVCDVVKPGLLWKGETERICDKLESLYEYTKVDTSRFKKYGDQERYRIISSPQWINDAAKDIRTAAPEMYDQALPVINRMFPEMSEEDKKKECEAMAVLAGRVCSENFAMFEQAVRDSLIRH
ncbi:MAG TPA: hypothetical protein VHX42_00335 [Candidatus Babeliales bacterium]|jgi:hypothetical protein|nr:hypothetical protein [Candidatus Babeliales bacterium]